MKNWPQKGFCCIHFMSNIYLTGKTGLSIVQAQTNYILSKLKKGECVKMKKFVAMAAALFFLVSVFFFVPCRSYAFNPQPEPPGKAKSGIVINESYIGTITKIEGNKITVRDDKGIEKIVTGIVAGLKIGGKVKVTTRDALTWLNPQPEPPKPAVEVNPQGLIQKNTVPGTPDTPNPPPSKKGLGQIK